MGRWKTGPLAPHYPMEGVYTALVGARFEKDMFMESQYILIKQKWSTPDHYGAHPLVDDNQTRLLKIWAKFLGEPHLPSYQEVDELFKADPEEASKTYHKHFPHSWDQEQYFFINKKHYKQRMRISIENFSWGC